MFFAKLELSLFPPFYSVVSPIDGKSMESITSVKIFHGSEYKANGKVIRWTEVSQSNWAACKPTLGILGLQLQPSLLLTCSPYSPKLKQQTLQNKPVLPFLPARKYSVRHRAEQNIPSLMHSSGCHHSQPLQPTLCWPPLLAYGCWTWGGTRKILAYCVTQGNSWFHLHWF